MKYFKVFYLVGAWVLITYVTTYGIVVGKMSQLAGGCFIVAYLLQITATIGFASKEMRD